MHTLIRSDTFDQWLEKLRDKRAKARITARLVSASFGNFGDCKPVGEGVSEMRIDVGAGYRVYYTATRYRRLHPAHGRQQSNPSPGYQASHPDGTRVEGVRP
ncbi:type II toxin-antitoxin system RelE/ParE family toxin [Ralstonia solanacearum]|uniref:type II toxin-antitoxin system RelE/ParE family toxin n=1 Tax=Ralstonia solanacearum TaxID=305 RepID=UPI000A79CFD6